MQIFVKKGISDFHENWGTTIDPKIAATAASWAIYGLADQWSHDKNKKRPSVEEFSEQVLPLIAGNLSLTQIS